MRFTLTIDCDNAAFGENGLQMEAEVSAILFKIASKMLHTTASGVVRDSNGNMVGRYAFAEPVADDAADKARTDALAALGDAIAMLEVYTDPRGRVNPSTRGQALSTIRDAKAAAKALSDNGATRDKVLDAAPEMLAALKIIAATPKNGEPEDDTPSPGNEHFMQDWSEDFGEHAIECLHDIIDGARTVVAKVEG